MTTAPGDVARPDPVGRAMSPVIVLTIGHSTRSLQEFCELLRAHQVTFVVDVRTVPRSRHNPQFDQASLPGALLEAGFGYAHLPALGGLRHAKRDSTNLAWRNASFRGYADYMQSPGFAQGLTQLIALANEKRVAMMCAEAVPWRCHRSLIADALLVRGIRVEDIMSLARRQVHLLTWFASVHGTVVTYPAEAPQESATTVPAKHPPVQHPVRPRKTTPKSASP